MAGEGADAWAPFGGLGAMIPNLAHVLELSVARGMEAALSSEKVQTAPGSHVSDERGNVDIIWDEPATISWERLTQRLYDQQPESSWPNSRAAVKLQTPTGSAPPRIQVLEALPIGSRVGPIGRFPLSRKPATGGSSPRKSLLASRGHVGHQGVTPKK